MPCHTSLRSTRTLLSLGLASGLLLACGDNGGEDDSTTTGVTATATVSVGSVTLTNPTTGDAESTAGTISASGDPTTVGKLDLPPDDTSAVSDCADKSCNLLDILFVIDNSGSMGEEQTNLAANFPYLIQKIRDLKDKKGDLVNADVNIMVTTSDFGHPLCTQFYKPDYTPAKGAPINTACTDRLERFNGIGANAPQIPEACTNGCTPGAAAVPDGPFINFTPEANNIVGSDGMGDAVADALSCIGPQGIDGCGMEADLETMLQALDPGKPWNSGDKPFLRPGAVLAIVMVTDEEDCATKDYKYFDPANVNDPNYNQYWEINPDKGVRDNPTSATCWNGGVTCTDANADGIYESCMSEDKGVLQPTERYVNYLKDVLIKGKDKQVVMLGILGVPPVTERNPDPPFQPTAGGVFDLVYRDWLPSDILPGDTKDAAHKQYDFGIGPGCSNAATGQAVPPVRIKEVCESLNVADDPGTSENDAKLRCCIESICDDDFSDAINCLAGILQNELAPAG